MKRNLRIRDRLLLALAILGDLLEEIHDPGGWMSNYYKTLCGWVPYRYKRSNFKLAVRRMLKAGFIEKIVKNGEPFLRITSEGRKKIIRDFPIFKLVGKEWKGEVTIIIFDIEEINKSEREGFRRFLYQLGAGKMQRSAYVLPYNLCAEMQDVVKHFGLSENVIVFPSNLDFVKDKKAFAFKVWKLGELEKEYKEILRILEKAEKQKGSERENLIKKAKVLFSEMVLRDPFLPKELLPEDWIGERVKKLLKKYC